ncbi:MAG: hypothetical protein ACP6IU_00465 [Candidatus Asgardarchaeia archaeon]
MIIAIHVLNDDGTPLLILETSEEEMDATTMSGALRIAKEMLATLLNSEERTLTVNDRKGKSVVMNELPDRKLILVFLLENETQVDNLKIFHITRIVEKEGINERSVNKIVKLVKLNKTRYRAFVWGQEW